MLVGDPLLRSAQGQQKQLCHRCFSNLQQDPFGGAPCTGNDTFDLPLQQCGGGIRTTITFPTLVPGNRSPLTLPSKSHANGDSSCWDGVNLDSPDHKSHVSYPASGSFETTGPCPSTHPVRLPQLMYEVMWDTREFNTPDLWPNDGSQPFVYSQGDGYVVTYPICIS